MVNIALDNSECFDPLIIPSTIQFEHLVLRVLFVSKSLNCLLLFNSNNNLSPKDSVLLYPSIIPFRDMKGDESISTGSFEGSIYCVEQPRLPMHCHIVYTYMLLHHLWPDLII